MYKYIKKVSKLYGNLYLCLLPKFLSEEKEEINIENKFSSKFVVTF